MFEPFPVPLRFLAPAFLLAVVLPAPLHAADADAEANRLFVEAVQQVGRADTTYDTRESVRLLRNADQLLKKIITRHPQSMIAVQLTTRQMIGDFDVVAFENRVRALACERGNNVQDFLSGYGITSATGPQTGACFLYRLENMLPPADLPLTQAHADWLGVAVAYDANGQHARARSMILPFMALLRQAGAGAPGPDSYALLARALRMTGADEQARQVGARIADCDGRLSLMLESLRQLAARDDDAGARDLAIQIRDEAEANHCDWQKGMVVQALSLGGMERDARALYDRIVPQGGMFSARDGTPPALVLAAAMVDEPQAALRLARDVEQDPASFVGAITLLARRGDGDVAHELIGASRDTSRKAVALAALIAASPEDDPNRAGWMGELMDLMTGPLQDSERAMTLAAKARAEKAMGGSDSRWRRSFQAALRAAERTDESLRAPVIVYLASTLVAIRTGHAGLE